MKNSIVAIAFAAITVSGMSRAADEQTTAATESVQSDMSHGGASSKTRADVRHELEQAQNDGQLGELRRLYRGS